MTLREMEDCSLCSLLELRSLQDCIEELRIRRSAELDSEALQGEIDNDDEVGNEVFEEDQGETIDTSIHNS